MPLRKYNRSYYQYQVTYRIFRSDRTEEVRAAEWNTDLLFHQVHFWNRKRLIRDSKHDYFVKLISKEKDIREIEVIKEDFVLVSRYTYEAY